MARSIRAHKEPPMQLRATSPDGLVDSRLAKPGAECGYIDLALPYSQQTSRFLANKRIAMAATSRNSLGRMTA